MLIIPCGITAGPSPIPEDGIQDDKDDKNGTKVKIKDINITKVKAINLLHNTWSYDSNTTEVQVNVTGDRAQLLIMHPDVGNVTLDMNFTYGKGKTFTKTKDKEKISYKTSDLNLTFAANTSALKEVIVVDKEKDKLFPLQWTISVTSEWNMTIERTNRTIRVDYIDIFTLQAFTATNATNGTVDLNETYSGGASSFNISLELGKVVDKDDYPLTIDPTVIIDVTDTGQDHQRNIAVNKSGIIYTISFDGIRLEYYTSNDGGKNWGSGTTIVTESGIVQTVMCIDINDNLHFAWKNLAWNSARHKCYWVGNSTWSSVTTLESTANHPELLPHGDGNVSVFIGGNNLIWKVWDGDSWSSETVIRDYQTSPAEQQPEATISSNETIHLVWQGTDSGSPGIYYSRSTDGSSFSTPTQIEGDLGGAWQPSIAVDSNDDLHVVYQGKNATHADTQIIYLKYDASASSWSSELYLTDASTTKHRYSTIAVDSNDTLYSIWCNVGVAGGSNDQIDMRYSADGGTTWSSATNLLDRTFASRYPQSLHYVYPDGVGNVPEKGFIFSFTEDVGGTPDYTIYYSSNWSLNPSIYISNEYPPNLGLSLPQPWCYATVNRSVGGEFNVSFWENSTGSWIERQENNSVTNGTFWWQYIQASSNGTDYYWKIFAENGSEYYNYIFMFTTFEDVNVTGEQITHCDLFRYVDGSIVDTYDLVNDTANYTVIFEPYRESAGWIADGAGSITKVDDTWYIVHRLRTGDTDKGHYLLLDSSKDLTSWTSVWNVSMDDVTPVAPNSTEKATLRYYNNSYYLYFCVDTGGIYWKTIFVKADTPADLEYSVANSDNWTLIVWGGKDPEVLLHNETYYIIVSDGMYKDDNPEFSSKTFIVDFHQMYKDTYNDKIGVPGCNTGTIMFDDLSGYFIFWRLARDSLNDGTINDILWFFAISSDMESWEAVDRHVKIMDYPYTTGTLRYPEYYVTEDETVCVLEWEDEIGSGNRSIVLWVYPTGEENSNGNGSGPYNPGGGGGGALHVTFTYQDTTWGIKFTPVHPTTHQVVSYKWLFGDGSSSTRRDPTHWYRNPGEYIVTLEIKFSTGVLSKDSHTITVNEFSDIQYLFHMIERDEDRVYFKFGYYEVVFTELSLVISGMLAFVAVAVSLHDRKKYHRRFKEGTATVLLRMIGIIWVGIAIILLIWIRMGGI